MPLDFIDTRIAIQQKLVNWRITYKILTVKFVQALQRTYGDLIWWNFCEIICRPYRQTRKVNRHEPVSCATVSTSKTHDELYSYLNQVDKTTSDKIHLPSDY